MKKTLSMLIVFLLVAVDQLTKVCIKLWLEPIGTARFIPSIVQFNYAENTGAAFGTFQNARWLFISITVIVCIGLFALMLTNRIKSGVIYTSFVLILAGGIGNLIDRIFRGYVVDFVEPTFMKFAIFNFADSLVSVGAVILVGYLICDLIKDHQQAKLAKGEVK